MKKLKPTIIGWLLALAPSLAPAEEPLTWVVSELTGFINLDESARLAGFVGRMQAALLAELPEFEVTLTRMSVPRMYRELQRQDNLCTGMLLRTPEREAFVHFSRPYVILSTPQIVLTEAAWQRLDQPASLPLDDLLNHPDLTGLRVEDRSYGVFIDRHLSDTGNGNGNGNMEGMATGFDNAVRMLGANRADYIIEYPPVVTQILGAAADDLAFVTIEGTPPFLDVSVGCAQSDFGRRVIERVNSVLADLVQDPDYRALNVDSQPQPIRADLVEYYRAAIEDAGR